MDTTYIWVSIGALALIVIIYFVTKKKRLQAHAQEQAQAKKQTPPTPTLATMGTALVVLGIVLDIGNRGVNYVFIGVGVLLSVIDLVRIQKRK